jgi:hypothetical protein
MDAAVEAEADALKDWARLMDAAVEADADALKD